MSYINGKHAIMFEILPVKGKAEYSTVSCFTLIPSTNRVTNTVEMKKIESQTIECKEDGASGYCAVLLLEVLNGIRKVLDRERKILITASDKT
jgi:hypothetical protein